MKTIKSFKELFDYLGTSDLEEIKKIKQVTSYVDSLSLFIFHEDKKSQNFYIEIKGDILILKENVFGFKFYLEEISKTSLIFNGLGTN